jgi:tetratricopeptide (TPR) repeat protein
LERTIGLSPVEGYESRAEARLAWGDLNGAIEDLQEVRLRVPGTPTAYSQLGLLLLQAGQVPEAIQFYQTLRPLLDPETSAALQSELIDLENTDPELAAPIAIITANFTIPLPRSLSAR